MKKSIEIAGTLVGRLRGRSVVLCLLVPLLACGSPQDSEPPSDATESPGEAAAPESPKFIQEVTWAPDGSRLAFYATVAPGDDRIYVMNADKTDRREVAEGYWPSTSEIFIANVDDSGEVQLTGG